MEEEDAASNATSEADENPPAQRPPQEFSLQLVYYIPTKGKRGNKGAKKEIRGKDLHFACTGMNYLDFLKALLKRYGESKYKITTTQRFAFKLYHPGRSCVFFFTHSSVLIL